LPKFRSSNIAQLESHWAGKYLFKAATAAGRHWPIPWPTPEFFRVISLFRGKTAKKPMKKSNSPVKKLFSPVGSALPMRTS
jgi:hypothetical protein